MNQTIQQERPDHPDAVVLIGELDGLLQPLYKSESRHGFSVNRLIDEGVHFFVVRADQQLVACGGVLFVNTAFGEVKRMYVRPAARGTGIARLLLEHLEAFTLHHGITLMRLETGIHQTAAIRLYERMGYVRIPPFPPYTDDPVSVCYEKRLG